MEDKELRKDITAGQVKHIEELKEKKSEYGRTITEMDIENIKLKEADRYNNIALRILDGLTDDFISCDEYKEMNKNEEIHIFAGGYMDKVRVLYESPSCEKEIR